MEKLRLVFGDYNQERLDSVNKQFLEEEVDLVLNRMADGVTYYKHIIDNIDLVDNPNNSYIMYIYDKVDSVDNTSPVSFIKAKSGLPDIDTDFPIECREEVIDYISKRYGKDCVAQVCTFGTLKGKSALKEVFRATGSCDFTTANKITEGIPDEAKISAELKESKEESILMWTIKNQPEVFQDYIRIEGNEIVGEFAEEFKKAVKLEGLIKSVGKHAAAVIIGDEPLENTYPMIASDDKMICGMEYTDIESQGGAKIDILGVAALSKLQSVNNLLRYGVLHYEKKSGIHTTI